MRPSGRAAECPASRTRPRGGVRFSPSSPSRTDSPPEEDQGCTPSDVRCAAPARRRAAGDAPRSRRRRPPPRRRPCGPTASRTCARRWTGPRSRGPARRSSRRPRRRSSSPRRRRTRAGCARCPSAACAARSRACRARGAACRRARAGVPAGRRRLPHLRRRWVDETAAIVAAHPSIVSAHAASARRYEGRPIWALKVSDNAASDEAEPEVLFTHNQHGREHLTVEMALYLLQRADRATTRTDARVTRRRQHARDLDRAERQPRRRRVRRRDRLLRAAGARTASPTPGPARSAPTSTATGAGSGAAAAARAGSPRRRPTAAPRRSRPPRRSAVRDLVDSRRRRRRAADQGRHRLPHLLRARAVALRLHVRRHGAGPDDRRRGGVQDARR